MRDYYEPELYRKLLDCREANNCEAVLKPIRPVTELNSLLPKASIRGIELVPEPDGQSVSRTALVTVEVEDGGEKGGPQSGIYDLRLFMNHRLVAIAPDVPDALVEPVEPESSTSTPSPDPSADKKAIDARLAQWRATHLLKPGRYVFKVPLPTGTDARILRFDAYAFNEDRIKSDPALISMMLRRGPFLNPRRPKAYVLNIGINAYDTQHVLSFSVSDAELMHQRLSSIPGYEMHVEALLGKQGEDGKIERVDAGTIVETLTRIATQATPDDIVIITYSGHGWADKRGNFYFVPSNGNWPAGWDQPDLRTMVSSTQIANILRQSHAREIALIIDACQSAGSFNTEGFKPGPMGDAGLGQLAYDKGILILAASQADALAHESGSLRQGLLTYALTSMNEAVTGSGSPARYVHDGKINLDDWLRFATRQLPTIAQSLYDPDTGHYRGFARGTGKDVLQTPVLFDFSRSQSPVQLWSNVIREVPYPPEAQPNIRFGPPLRREAPPRAIVGTPLSVQPPPSPSPD